MEFILQLLAEFGAFVRPYKGDIALALVASLLVIAGGDINKWLKRQISSANFLLRTLIFVLVCTFGYGALTVLLSKFLERQLAALSNSHLAMATALSFIAIGVYAARKRQI